MDRLLWERKTVEKMVVLYCRHHHGTASEKNAESPAENLSDNVESDSCRQLCPSCRDLLDYATIRIEKCRYGLDKPPCSACDTHCYQPAFREQIRRIMRYSGPRMLIYHPLTALVYLWRKRVRLFTANR